MLCPVSTIYVCGISAEKSGKNDGKAVPEGSEMPEFSGFFDSEGKMQVRFGTVG